MTFEMEPNTLLVFHAVVVDIILILTDKRKIYTQKTHGMFRLNSILFEIRRTTNNKRLCAASKIFWNNMTKQIL